MCEAAQCFKRADAHPNKPSLTEIAECTKDSVDRIISGYLLIALADSGMMI